MRTAIATIATATALVFAPSALASTEIGSNCNSTTAGDSVVLLSLSHGASSPLPIAVPTSGVITSWKTSTSLPIPPEAANVYAQQLLVVRPTGAPNQFTKIAESQPAPILAGANSFAARITVQAGDRLGVTGPFAVLYCQTGDPGDSIGVKEGALPLVIGGTATFSSSPPGYQVPIAAVIEPDVDGDGYGDETQDGCPQSALYHEACPLVTISGFALAGKGSVTVRVATSLDAPVSVSGTVNLGKGKKATLKAAAKTVTAGKLTAFSLKFSKKLKERLRELEPSRKLTLKIAASATNVAGVVSTAKSNAKLKGQGS